MERFEPSIGNPAADSAALLRRLAFFLLFLVMPAAAVVARRALVIIAPTTVGLLVLAAVLDRRFRPAGPDGTRMLLSPGMLIGLLVIGWCFLSLLWTPFPKETSERLVSMVSSIAVIGIGYIALPDRMRASNLYLLPIGVGIALALALAIELADPRYVRFVDMESVFQRGVFVLVLLFWPSVAWLRSRHHDVAAVMMLVAMLVVLAATYQTSAMSAFLIGACGYVLTKFSKEQGVRLATWITGGAVALAPLLPFILKPIASALQAPALAASLDACQKLILNDPLRVITGRGFETATRMRVAGMLDPEVPSSALFQIWYELGLIGAFGIAAVIVLVIRRVAKMHDPLASGMVAGFLSAYTLACMGVGATQAWWTNALACTILIFMAASRGQFRTQRPRIFIVRA